MSSPDTSIVAVDIGNSRIKLGRFDRSPQCEAAAQSAVLPIAPPALAEPAETFAFGPPALGEAFDFAELDAWLDEQVIAPATIVVASVSRPACKAFCKHLASRHDADALRVTELSGSDFPIENRTEFPEKVGIDRLAAAVAANRIRRPSAGAVVVDFGTAITVDLITPEGDFAGGAILPGVGLSASALAQRTDALPQVDVRLDGKSPASVGTSTTLAIESGIYWGAVGAVRELIARHTDGLTAAAQVLVTGSTSPDLARLLGTPDYTVRYLPHLVLSGISIAAERLGNPSP